MIAAAADAGVTEDKSTGEAFTLDEVIAATEAGVIGENILPTLYKM